MKVKSLGANKTTIEFDNGIIVFISYETPVACYIPLEGYFKTTTKYSRTTTKYINQWLSGVKAEEVKQSVIDNLIGV